MNFCSLVYLNLISAIEFVPLLEDEQHSYRALMGNLLLLPRIQEPNQQGLYGLPLMLVQRYMLAAQG